MENTGFAYFAERPRRLEDLFVPHLLDMERPYEVVRVVNLAKIDYENFITDMLADRTFIEDSSELYSREEIWKCLLVQQRGRMDGVLVMPKAGRCVGWAAYVDFGAGE